MGTNPLEGLILQQHLKDAQEHSAKVKQIMRQEEEAHRKSWEALNSSLALFSSGTIALSITYLGYLQSAGIKVTHPWLLFASWACLLVNIPMALFVPFIHTYYVSYARGREYNESLKNLKEVEAEMLPNANVVDMADSEKPAMLANLKASATAYGKAAKRAEKFSNFYYGLWRFMGVSARLLFVVGIGFLLAFATSNIRQWTKTNSPLPKAESPFHLL